MNFYQVLGDEGEVASQPQRTATSSKPSGSSTSKPQGQRQYDNRGPGRQGGNRPPRDRGTDPVDVQKKGRVPRRDHEKKPVKSEERLERHSGTGRSFENKKGGHGKANWGQAEKEDENVQQPAPVEPEPVVETEEEKQKREEEEKKREEERIKEEKQMTLEDYLKSKKSVSITLPPPRSANEGITEQDKKKWAPLPVEGEAPKTSGTAATASTKEGVKFGNEHLSVLGEFFNVRIKDDAHSRRRQQRFDAERRDKEKEVQKPVVQQTGASLLTEDPRMKQTGQKKKNRGKVPTKEDFPDLKA